MIATPQTLDALRERWIARRDELRRLHALVDGAVLCDELLAELDHLADATADEPLSLRRAAAESGYSVDHLGRLVREGKLANVGRPHSPRVRRADLPRKPSRQLASPTAGSYNPSTDARSLLARRGE